MPDDTFRWVITGGVLISTLCILIMAATVVILYRVLAKVQTRVDGMATQVEPIIDTVRRITDESAPRISLITASVVEIADNAKDVAVNAKDVSEVAKDQAHRFAEVGKDIADRSRAQIARVDAAVDETVEKVQLATENVKIAAMKPVHEASAIMAGVKAAVASYHQGRRPPIDHITQDEEMFI